MASIEFDLEDIHISDSDADKLFDLIEQNWASERWAEKLEDHYSLSELTMEWPNEAEQFEATEALVSEGLISCDTVAEALGKKLQHDHDEMLASVAAYLYHNVPTHPRQAEFVLGLYKLLGDHLAKYGQLPTSAPTQAQPTTNPTATPAKDDDSASDDAMAITRGMIQGDKE